ncbi:unnamed protein product [Fraxinus pennsylvanica]|uniref:CTLH domain-containing protein n=1 Tax=Fraxinus pennsylvanica TaxID=56036 RepID=A0AAD2EC94_9LAMI|nr:unnamed protein product [Fraxinus pennsylvanica]
MSVIMSVLVTEELVENGKNRAWWYVGFMVIESEKRWVLAVEKGRCTEAEEGRWLWSERMRWWCGGGNVYEDRHFGRGHAFALLSLNLLFFFVLYRKTIFVGGVGKRLEQESGIFFSMPYFEDRVTNGDWDEVENYLSGFTWPDENTISMKIFYAIREHKYMEVLDRKERAKAFDILMMDLKQISVDNEERFEYLTRLFFLENIREDKEVSKHGDLINARGEMLARVKKLIEENPVFRDKLIFPTFDPSKLGTLSLNLQHHLAAVSPSQSRSAVPKPVESPPPFQDPSSPPQPSASYSSSVPHPSDSADIMKHPTTPTNKPAVDNQNDLSELDSSYESTPISTFGDVNATTGSSIKDRASPVTSTDSVNEGRQNSEDGKPRVADGSTWKSRLRKLIEVNKPSECRVLRLPDSSAAMKVPRLMYTNSGSAILALYVNAVHKLWKSPENDSISMGKFPTNRIRSCTARLMTNATSGMNPEDAVPCFALSNNDSYVMSASGRKISYFNTLTFQTKKSFTSHSSEVTFLAFHPQNNNIIAMGLDDSSIQIYDVKADEVKTELKAHQKRITGLAFSNILNVLVSSGADSWLCVWSTDTWEKRTNEYLRRPAGRSGASLADTHVQFHQDQTHLLAFQETQIVIYEVEAANLDWRAKWPLQASVPITYATYSCDSKSIYVSFICGSISVLTAASLRLRCRINPSLYLPANPSLQAYPLVIAAHPSKPNQFAIGLTDGGVYVLEPLESEGKWYP